MQCQRAGVRPAPMLEEVNRLPSSEGQLTADNRNTQLDLSQRRTNMRRHIVRAFIIVGVRRW